MSEKSSNPASPTSFRAPSQPKNDPGFLRLSQLSELWCTDYSHANRLHPKLATGAGSAPQVGYGAAGEIAVAEEKVEDVDRVGDVELLVAVAVATEELGSEVLQSHVAEGRHAPETKRRLARGSDADVDLSRKSLDGDRVCLAPAGSLF